jgi:DNA-binding XRE family transcriptional regulator
VPLLLNRSSQTGKVTEESRVGLRHTSGVGDLDAGCAETQKRQAHRHAVIVVSGESRRSRRACSSGPGGLLRHHRRNAGLGQPTLAERAGVSVRTLRDIEHGRVIRPRDTSVHQLLAALSLTDLDRAVLLDAFAVHSGRNPARSRPGFHIGVLGPLLLRHRDGPLAADQAMPRTLLCLLALHPGEPVPTAAAIDVLWGDDPPRACHNLIQVYIGRLRRILTSGRPARTATAPIRLTTASYVLDPAAVSVDVVDFDAFFDQAVRAQAAGDPDTAAARYLGALRCWRGTVLDDADQRLRHHPTAVRLTRRRVEVGIGDDAQCSGGLGVEPPSASLRLNSSDLPARIVLSMSDSESHCACSVRGKRPQEERGSAER